MLIRWLIWLAKLGYLNQVGIVSVCAKLSKPQPNTTQPNLNLVGFDMIIAVHTTTPPTTPPGTLLPSNAASDQPLMFPKQQHQH